MSDLAPWLPTVEPPVGGYARLAATLAARRTRGHRHWQWRLGLASASLAILMMAVLVVPVVGEVRQEQRQAALVATSLEQAWTASVANDLTVSNGAAITVLRAPAVRLYWVGVNAGTPGIRGERK